jgi:hypothetical protein
VRSGRASCAGQRSLPEPDAGHLLHGMGGQVAFNDPGYTRNDLGRPRDERSSPSSQTAQIR